MLLFYGLDRISTEIELKKCRAQTRCKLTEKNLTPRDIFECEYIARHMSQDVYESAKSSIESLRNGIAYDDDDVKIAFYRWIDGLDWGSPEPQKSNRVGDIHIGGEILPEFNSEKWCNDCGAPVENLHLRNCPAVKGDVNG